MTSLFAVVGVVTNNLRGYPLRMMLETTPTLALKLSQRHPELVSGSHRQGFELLFAALPLLVLSPTTCRVSPTHDVGDNSKHWPPHKKSLCPLWLNLFAVVGVVTNNCRVSPRA